ncbi:TPA: hypothetical protein QCR75_005693, partial [Bacillus anthracis]|nr:hypothetical protein [Bacillus anthracis]
KKMLDKEDLVELPVEILDNMPPTYTNNIEQFKNDIVKELQEQFKIQLQEELQKQEDRIIKKVTQKQLEQIQSENNKLMDYIAVTREEEKKKGFFNRIFGR